MGVRKEDITLVHRIVGSKHVFTSPDVPELHISHSDRQVAYDNVQPALDLLDQMKQRIKAREDLCEQMGERAVA